MRKRARERISDNELIEVAAEAYNNILSGMFERAREIMDAEISSLLGSEASFNDQVAVKNIIVEFAAGSGSGASANDLMNMFADYLEED